MEYPNLSEEKKLWRKEFDVIGVDEAGRGPLAGPVIAAAVLIKSDFEKTAANIRKLASGLQVRDSKLLSAKMREELYDTLIHHSHIEWGTGRVSHRVIDRINILQATRLAMKRAVLNLNKKIGRGRTSVNLAEAGSMPVREFLILDGRMDLDLDIAQKSIVKADFKVFSCAAASIIAKVRRDRLMRKYAKLYPNYGFSRHKGYGTRLHFEKLKKHGSCPIHRKSFKPVSELLSREV